MSRKKQTEVVDLWDSSSVEMSEEPKEIKKPKRVSKSAQPKLSEMFVITAGINRATDRQLFVSTFDDCDDWSISVVPTIMSRTRAVKLMDKAQQYINDNPNRYRYKPPTLLIESLENPDIYKIARYLLK